MYCIQNDELEAPLDHWYSIVQKSFYVMNCSIFEENCNDTTNNDHSKSSTQQTTTPDTITRIRMNDTTDDYCSNNEEYNIS
jgi:hypothetical protein